MKMDWTFCAFKKAWLECRLRDHRLAGRPKNLCMWNTQTWTEHIEVTIRSLNMRLYLIRRIMNHIPKKYIMKLVHSLWLSKIRYGIQLWATTRTSGANPIKLFTPQGGVKKIPELPIL